MKKWMVMAATTAGAILVSLAAVAAAPYTVSAQAGATATTPAAAATAAGTTAPGAWPGGDFHGPHGPRAEDALVNATASVTGLTTQQVISNTQSGQSLSQIATANGKTAEAVIAAAKATLTTQLQADVTAGKLTQAQSDAALAQFDQDAPQIMADTALKAGGAHGFGPGGGRGGPGGRGPDGLGGAGALISATASVTGLTNEDIQTQLQAGQSLAQIAQAKGKTTDDILTAAKAALNTQLQQDVTAGKLTQAQADAKLAQFDSTATTVVNDTTLGQHTGGHGGHGGPGFHGQGGPNGPNGQGGPGNPDNATPSATPATGTSNS